MEKLVWRGPVSALLAAGLAIAAFVGFPRAAAGLDPNSPEVKRAIDAGIKFLESDLPAAKGSQLGAEAVVGIALLQYGAGPMHPRVAKSGQAARSQINSVSDPTKLNFDIYTTGLTLVFLVDLDPVAYRSEINALLKYLEFRQKPHGGWGYPPGHQQYGETGDTSMTQYPVLGCWKATQAGFDVPQHMVENVAVWLLKTQDPGGGFGYQGTVSPSFQPIPQAGIRRSLSAAGLGAVYICADLLGVSKRSKIIDDGLPPGVKVVKEQSSGRPQRFQTRIDPALFRAVQQRGNRWMEANFVAEPQNEGDWTHYYQYAFERYLSFRQLAEGKVEAAPKWYDEVARFLIDTQNEDGSWYSRAGMACDTAFAILFLLRSSKKSIDKVRDFDGGTLIGGRGLPSESKQVKVRQGNVVRAANLARTEKLLAAIKKAPDADSIEAVEALADLPPGEARPLVSKYAKMLQQMAGGTSAAARLAAVRALGKTGNVNHAPTLIYALTDPDPAVVLAARDSLRRISRRFDGFGLPDEYTQAELREAIENWKAWYLAIRPDAEFEN